MLRHPSPRDAPVESSVLCGVGAPKYPAGFGRKEREGTGVRLAGTAFAGPSTGPSSSSGWGATHELISTEGGAERAGDAVPGLAAWRRIRAKGIPIIAPEQRAHHTLEDLFEACRPRVLPCCPRPRTGRQWAPVAASLRPTRPPGSCRRVRHRPWSRRHSTMPLNTAGSHALALASAREPRVLPHRVSRGRILLNVHTPGQNSPSSRLFGCLVFRTVTLRHPLISGRRPPGRFGAHGASRRTSQ
jgi:hypothetical protein